MIEAKKETLSGPEFVDSKGLSPTGLLVWKAGEKIVGVTDKEGHQAVHDKEHFREMAILDRWLKAKRNNASWYATLSESFIAANRGYYDFVPKVPVSEIRGMVHDLFEDHSPGSYRIKPVVMMHIFTAIISHFRTEGKEGGTARLLFLKKLLINSETRKMLLTLNNTKRMVNSDQRIEILIGLMEAIKMIKE